MHLNITHLFPTNNKIVSIFTFYYENKNLKFNTKFYTKREMSRYEVIALDRDLEEIFLAAGNETYSHKSL